MVFTISCSGSDGKNGTNARCTASPAEGGLNITCDDGTTGFLSNGIQGPQGLQGIPGTVPENICTLGAQKPDGSWTITCAGHNLDLGDTEMQLVGCQTEVSDDNVGVVLTCGGAELYLCGGIAYNPEEDHCEAWQSATYQGDGGLISGLSPAPTYYGNTIGVVVASICNAEKYDSRKQFCDYSVVPNKIQYFCGPKKEKYRTGGPWSELCGATFPGPATYDIAKISSVSISCGTTRITKAEQFCMDGTTPTARCGVQSASGQYSAGTKATASATYNANGTLKYAGDGNFNYYAPGFAGSGTNTAGIPASNPTGAVQTGGVLYLGEYSTKNQERCLDGKIVKVCGTQYYEESWQFCAAQNRVAPHCSDRVTYDPDKKFCSYVGNSEDNVPTYFGYDTDKWWYNANLPVTACRDANGDSYPACQQYTSTAVSFCGTGTAAANTYNYDERDGKSDANRKGAWSWEYCTEPTKGVYNVLRCPVMQEPAEVAFVDVNQSSASSNATERSRCQCIPGAKLLPIGQNGCECAPGFVYDGSKATGVTYKVVGNDTTARLSGGECVAIPGTCSAMSVNEEGECCPGSQWAIFAANTSNSTARCVTPCTGVYDRATGTCVSNCPAASTFKQYNGVPYCNTTSSSSGGGTTTSSSSSTPLPTSCPAGEILKIGGTACEAVTSDPIDAAGCTTASATGANASGTLDVSRRCTCLTGSGYTAQNIGGAWKCGILAYGSTTAYCTHDALKAPGNTTTGPTVPSVGCIMSAECVAGGNFVAANGECACATNYNWFGANSVTTDVNKCLANCATDQVFTAEGNSECVWKDAASASGSSTVLKVCTDDASTGKFCDNGASACAQTTTGTCD